MITINAYLNFPGNTEEAFEFYKAVFGGEFLGITRFKDVADLPGREHLSEKDLNGVMNIQLPVGNNILMGTDALESMGQRATLGNSVTLSVHPDSKKEADRLYEALSTGGKPSMPMADMFWGDYWGMLTDKFGIQWMVNYRKQQS